MLQSSEKETIYACDSLKYILFHLMSLLALCAVQCSAIRFIFAYWLIALDLRANLATLWQF